MIRVGRDHLVETTLAKALLERQLPASSVAGSVVTVVFVEELTAPGDLGPWAYLRSLNEPRVLVANTHGEMRAAMAEFDLVINIPKNNKERELRNDYIIRRSAIDFNIPLFTNIKVAKQFIDSLETQRLKGFEIKSWEEYR